MSLMMEAFHANIIISTFSVAIRDRVYLPVQEHNWVHPSDTQEGW